MYKLIILSFVTAFVVYLLSFHSLKDPELAEASTQQQHSVIDVAPNESRSDDPLEKAPAKASRAGAVASTTTHNANHEVTSSVFLANSAHPEMNELLSNISELTQLGERSSADDFYLALAATYCSSFSKHLEEPGNPLNQLDFSECSLVPSDFQDYEKRVAIMTRAAESGHLHALEMFDQVFETDPENLLRNAIDLEELRIRNERYLWQAANRGSDIALTKLVFGYQQGVTMRQDDIYSGATAIALHRRGGLNERSLGSILINLTTQQRDQAETLSRQIFDRIEGG